MEWKDDPFHYHWNLGQVVDDVPAGLEIALKRAFSRQKQLEKIQKEAFDYTFYNEPGTTAADRGAKALAEFLFKQLKKDKTNA